MKNEIKSNETDVNIYSFKINDFLYFEEDCSFPSKYNVALRFNSSPKNENYVIMILFEFPSSAENIFRRMWVTKQVGPHWLSYYFFHH